MGFFLYPIEFAVIVLFLGDYLPQRGVKLEILGNYENSTAFSSWKYNRISNRESILKSLEYIPNGFSERGRRSEIDERASGTRKLVPRIKKRIWAFLRAMKERRTIRARRENQLCVGREKRGKGAGKRRTMPKSSGVLPADRMGNKWATANLPQNTLCIINNANHIRTLPDRPHNVEMERWCENMMAPFSVTKPDDSLQCNYVMEPASLRIWSNYRDGNEASSDFYVFPSFITNKEPQNRMKTISIIARYSRD